MSEVVLVRFGCISWFEFYLFFGPVVAGAGPPLAPLDSLRFHCLHDMLLSTRLHHQRRRHRAAPSSLPWMRPQPWLASSSLASTRLNIPADFSRCAHRDGNPASAKLTDSLLPVFSWPHVFHLLRRVSPRVTYFHQTGEKASVCSLEFHPRCDRLCHPWTKRSLKMR